MVKKPSPIESKKRLNAKRAETMKRDFKNWAEFLEQQLASNIQIINVNKKGPNSSDAKLFSNL